MGRFEPSCLGVQKHVCYLCEGVTCINATLAQMIDVNMGREGEKDLQYSDTGRMENYKFS